MSKLDDWIANNQRDVMSPDLMDIGKFPEIKKLFFQQIEDLDFEAELYRGIDDNLAYPGASEEYVHSKPARLYILSLRLSYPDKSKKPYKFLYDTARRTIVPQYTSTHTVVRTGSYGSDEYNTLTKLTAFLESSLKEVSPKKKSYYVPVSEDKNFVSVVHGESTENAAKFIFTETLGEPINNMYGHISFYYDDDVNNVIATQETDTKGFYIAPNFTGLSVSVKKDDTSIVVGLSGKCIYPDFDFSKVRAIVSYNFN